jgi:hypothetical protein
MLAWNGYDDRAGGNRALGRGYRIDRAARRVPVDADGTGGNDTQAAGHRRLPHGEVEDPAVDAARRRAEDRTPERTEGRKVPGRLSRIDLLSEARASAIDEQHGLVHDVVVARSLRDEERTGDREAGVGRTVVGQSRRQRFVVSGGGEPELEGSRIGILVGLG